jgi:superfamily II DNA or RNA helicase
MKTLRPYQAAAIEAIRADLQHHKSTVVVLATGLGKTVIAAKLMAEWRGNCLFLAHTRELIHQAADKLADELGYQPGIEMGIEAAELCGRSGC